MTAWAPPLLHKADGRADRLLGGALVGAEGEIGQEEGLPSGATSHHPGVVDHLVEGHGKRGLLPLDDHAEGVSHQGDVNAGLGEKLAVKGVVGGDGHDGRSRPLARPQSGNGESPGGASHDA